MGFKNPKEMAEIQKITAAINAKAEKLPGSYFADNTVSAVNYTVELITTKYMAASEEIDPGTFADDLEYLNNISALLSCEELVTLTDLAAALQSRVQKEAYIICLETYWTSEFYSEAYYFTNKLNAFISDIDRFKGGTVIFTDNERTRRAVLIPRPISDDISYIRDKSFGYTDEFHFDGAISRASELLRAYTKLKRAYAAAYTPPDVFSAFSCRAYDRQKCLEEGDYSLLDRLFSYYVLTADDMRRIGNIIERNNFFSDDRRDIYRMFAEYREGDTKLLKKIRTVLEKYYFNDIAGYYDDYLYSCRVNGNTPKALLSFGSLDELIAAASAPSGDPLSSDGAGTEMKIRGRKAEMLMKFRGIEEEYERIREKAERVKRDLYSRL